VAGHLQTLYKKPFSLLTGCLVNSKECSLKNASNAICDQSTPTMVCPLSTSLQYIIEAYIITEVKPTTTIQYRKQMF